MRFILIAFLSFLFIASAAHSEGFVKSIYSEGLLTEQYDEKGQLLRKFIYYDRIPIAVMENGQIIPVVPAPPTVQPSSVQPSDPNLKTLRALLQKPDDQIDLARTKLTIDRMIDPSIDIETNLKQLDAVAQQIKGMLPPHASSLEKMETLQKYIYQAGIWNWNRPYRYDLEDPFGRNIKNKLLPTYLSTRKGNCISMPILFIILGQKLGLEVTASTAPLHLFVKYRLDDGNLYNFEATSGGRMLDSSMQRNFPMTSQALANGIYMQPLSKKETVAVMIELLLEYYGKTEQEERRIALANLVLKYYPKSVSAMLHTGSAYNRLVKQHFMSRYPNPNDIPQNERPYFFELSQKNKLWFDKAEALGWRMPDPESEVNYIKSIERAKLTKQGEK